MPAAPPVMYVGRSRPALDGRRRICTVTAIDTPQMVSHPPSLQPIVRVTAPPCVNGIADAKKNRSSAVGGARSSSTATRRSLTCSDRTPSPMTASRPSAAAARPTSGYNVDLVANDSGFVGIKRLLLGKPIPSHLAHHERLSRVT